LEDYHSKSVFDSKPFANMFKNEENNPIENEDQIKA